MENLFIESSHRGPLAAGYLQRFWIPFFPGTPSIMTKERWKTDQHMLIIEPIKKEWEASEVTSGLDLRQFLQRRDRPTGDIHLSEVIDRIVAVKNQQRVGIQGLISQDLVDITDHF